MSLPAKTRALAFIAEIDQSELTVRIMEIGIGLRRTPAVTDTTAQIIATAKKNWEASGAGPFPFDRMAVAAIEYFRECVDRGQAPS